MIRKGRRSTNPLDLIRFRQQLQHDGAKRGNPLLFGLTVDEQDQ
jgi:hypothetical protein